MPLFDACSPFVPIGGAAPLGPADITQQVADGVRQGILAAIAEIGAAVNMPGHERHALEQFRAQQRVNRRTARAEIRKALHGA